jgi:uncharacterized membrane protein YfcA
MMQIFLIGIAAGMFGGLAGLGGGVIMIPLLVSIRKFTQHMAHGTSLVALVFTGIAGSLTYYLNGSVDITASFFLAGSAIITAPAGARFANSLPGWRLKRYFGFFLVAVSVLLLSKPYLSSHLLVTALQYRYPVLIMTGLLTGFLSGMMGVGGGTVMVPALVLFSGMGQHMGQGTALFAMVPAGGVGAFTHWKLGNVDIRVLPALIPGIAIGTYWGSTAAHLLPDFWLRLIFTGILLWTGISDIRTRRSD